MILAPNLLVLISEYEKNKLLITGLLFEIEVTSSIVAFPIQI